MIMRKMSFRLLMLDITAVSGYPLRPGRSSAGSARSGPKLTGQSVPNCARSGNSLKDTKRSREGEGNERLAVQGSAKTPVRQLVFIVHNAGPAITCS